MKTAFTTFIIIIMLGALCCFGQTDIYNIDKSHSKVGFTASLGGLIDVEGTFRNFHGSVSFDKENIELTGVSLYIETSSIDTDIEIRDNHLKQEEYLDAEKFPFITFKSKDVKKNGGTWNIIGDLEIKGVKKEIEVPFTTTGLFADIPWGNQRITYKGELKLNRRDFGVGSENEKMAGIANEVQINFSISARKFNLDKMAIFHRPFGKEIIEKVNTEGYEAAILLYDEFVKQDNEDAKRVTSLDFIGERLMEMSLLKESIAFFELNHKTFPDHSGVLAALAAAYLKAGDRQKALTYATEVMKKDPTSSLASEVMRVASR